MSTPQQERLTTEAVSEETFDVFGIQLQFLVTPQQTNEQVSVYRGTIPRGVFIPLHSHAESEIFYVLGWSFRSISGCRFCDGMVINRTRSCGRDSRRQEARTSQHFNDANDRCAGYAK
ncbi:MAG: Cupin 2 conserved barrel domain protein [Edaphobacter sp.]|nr:Cupin 2 conserved barrel domain protein [Edaphobacter sp.]